MRPRLFLVAALVAGCGHQVSNPTPSVSTISPRLVCTEELTTPVSVSGMNFTPLPTRTLRKFEQLNLPQVSLQESQGLDGTAMSGMPVSIYDDPNVAIASHIRWESEMQMSFDVYPQLMLTPGVYDLTVTNPDGHKATMMNALAAVPPPKVMSIVPPNICDAQSDQTVMVLGANFLEVGMTTPTVTILDGSGMPVASPLPTTATNCAQIAKPVMDQVSECSTLSFVVKEGSIQPGTYTLVVTNPAPAPCESQDAVQFVVEPPPTLTGVVPSHICAGGGVLDLSGTGFLPGASVTLTDETGGAVFTAGNTNVTDPNDAVATFGSAAGYPVGDTLDVALQNKDGCVTKEKHTVTVVPGPIIFYVDPPFVYGNITTPVTVYTTGLTDTLANPGGVLLIPEVSPSPSPSPATIDLTANSTVDTSHTQPRVIIDVPPTVPPGTYTLELVQSTGCPAFYQHAITVETNKTDLKDIIPPFGNNVSNTAVQIDATASFFKPGARAYIAPTTGTSKLAIPLTAVVYQNDTQLTAIVPGAPPHTALPLGVYDVITVNPTGEIGLLAGGFTVVSVMPPVVTQLSPGQLPTNCSGAGCYATLEGENFAASPTVTANCLSGTTPSTKSITITPSPAPTATALSLDLTPTISLTAGTVCTFHVAQNGVYADGGTLVLTNPSSNLAMLTTGNNLVSARRSPGLVYNSPTTAAHYIYALGGDDGSATSGHVLNSVEFAKVDPVHGGFAPPPAGNFVQMPISTARASTQGTLPTARTYSGAVSIGRFIYVVGGYDGTNVLNSVQRAEVLDPDEAPQIDDADLTPNATSGLSPGLYFYRVSAVLSGSDVYNPNGETLSGDEFAINVPTITGKKVQVTIKWIKGLKTPTTAVKWRVYRTTNPNATPGTEDLVYETADASNFIIIDNGTTATYGTGTLTALTGGPLPFGAIGDWASPTSQLPSPSPNPAVMKTARAGAGVTVAPDPSPAPGTTKPFYIYAGYGASSLASTGTFPATYEYLQVDLKPTGPVESSVGWVQANITSGQGRWQLGAYAETSSTDQTVQNAPTIFFTNGTNSPSDTSGGAVKYWDRGAITPGAGALVMGTPVNDNNADTWGYGAVTAVNYVFELGGQRSMNYLNENNSFGIQPGTTPGTLVLGSYNPQGSGVFPDYLFLPGATVGGAYFWVAGGTGGATNSATTAMALNKTFYVLY